MSKIIMAVSLCGILAFWLVDRLSLQSRLEISQRQTRDALATFDKMAAANDELMKAFKSLKESNHTNEQTIRDCQSGWRRTIESLKESYAHD